VIFIAGSDPVLDGLVPSLAHPGGNLTGFYVFEPSLGAKLLGLLKEIAPHVARAALLLNPDANPASWLASAVAAATRFAVEVVPAPLRNAGEIEQTMAKWGREPNIGVIVVPDPATNAHRKLINELAVRHRLPVIHALRAAAVDGGLMSYGVDLPNVFRQASVYADRILKGVALQLTTHFRTCLPPLPAFSLVRMLFIFSDALTAAKGSRMPAHRTCFVNVPHCALCRIMHPGWRLADSPSELEASSRSFSAAARALLSRTRIARERLGGLGLRLRQRLSSFSRW
jgi:hypothetical protein